MAETSKIEWTDSTWQPITGCTLVSEGCRHCYAARLTATRLKNHPSRKGLARINAAGEAKFTGEVRFNEQWLTQPLTWKRPRRIFVCAHGDLFHEGVPDEWIDRVFAVMALAPQHTFQVLTKRPERMRQYMLETWQGTPAQRLAFPDGTGIDLPAGGPSGRRAEVEEACEPLLEQFGLTNTSKDDLWTEDGKCKAMQWAWPLPNVWLGTSVEDQPRADERIPHLLQTPAAVHFVSAEPVLGPIDLTHIRFRGSRGGLEDWDALDLHLESGDDDDGSATVEDSGAILAWVIVGGESGPNARPMHPDWARSLRDQCTAAGVPFFFKQWGEWAPVYDRQREDPDWHRCDAVARETPNGQWLNLAGGQGFHGEWVVRMNRLGKHRAGRLLDGREWSEWPEARP